MKSVFCRDMCVAEHSLRGVETAEAPPAADGARLFRGSGTIGGADSAGNRIAATVAHYWPLYAANRGAEHSESFSSKWLCHLLDDFIIAVILFQFNRFVRFVFRRIESVGARHCFRR